jgi:AraC-like DNA-binding protein
MTLKASVLPASISLSRDPRVLAVVTHLEAHPFGDDSTLPSLAKKLNVSASYLRHRFKDSVGLSFNEYVRRLRFERARILLKNSTMTVKQVMIEVGLLDHSSFAKRYKKYFGETPTRTKQSGSPGKWLLALASPLNSNSDHTKSDV